MVSFGLRWAALAVALVGSVLPIAPSEATTAVASIGTGQPTTKVVLQDGDSATLSNAAQLLAFTWPDPALSEIRYRVSSVDGTVGSWTTAAAEVGGGEETAVGTDALMLEPFDRVEIRAASSTPITVLAAATGHSHPALALIAPGAAPVGRPGIHPRSEWTTTGWQCSRAPTASSRLDAIVVHHTVVPPGNDYTADQVPGILRFVQDLHLSKGACDVEYNAFVDRFGHVWEGRVGGVTRIIDAHHTAGFPSDSWGIALIGQHEPDRESGPASSVGPAEEATPAALSALTQVIAWKAALHGLDPLGTVTLVSTGNRKFTAGTAVTVPTVLGHRDLQATACPGLYVYDLLPDMRADAAATTAEAVLGSAGFMPPREVMRLYRAAFLRLPDADGLRYWWWKLAEGSLDITGVAQLFADSPEFRSRYGALGNVTFVAQVYWNVLGRAPDGAGLAYWTGKLASRSLSRGAVLAGFSDSPEHRALTHVATEVQMGYFHLLDRMPTAAEIAASSDALYRGLPYRAFLRSLLPPSDPPELTQEVGS